MFYPKSLEVLYQAIPAAAKKFGVSEQTALFNLILVVIRSEDVYRTARAVEAFDAAAESLGNPDAQRGDPVITCDLCKDDSWWQENYGSVWQWAQWWYCGPFGLNCSGE